MKTAKGLHLWVATFSPWSQDLWIKTRLRAPLVAVRRAQRAAKDAGMRVTFEAIKYKGTIDA
jgi:hypothetical protein